ncbi:MAG: hypothetical protein LBM99_01300 [Bacillales bacterium]|jgi:beta-galactosidase|nr:hypothetical protein [Bacillales bacterium]
MKKESLNLGWKFYQENSDTFEIVNIPHTVKKVPLSYFDEKMYQFISYYEKEIEIVKEEKEYFLLFEGVLTISEVFINDVFVGLNEYGFVDYKVNVTDYLIDGLNKIKVKVNSQEIKDIPPFGNLVDFLTFGGIYRDVSLLTYQKCHIEKYNILYNGVSTKIKVYFNMVYQGSLKLTFKKEKEIKEYFYLLNANYFEIDIYDTFELWSVTNPNLYDVVIETNEIYQSTFGFRTLSFEADKGFLLNNKPLKLFGLNTSQSYPFIGFASTKNIEYEDVRILKEYGVNILRTHYPRSRHFLDACEKYGILVFEETPGWQYIGNEKFKNMTINYVRKMIERDINRACIMFWGVRINESEDDEVLYKETNRVAHELDKSRFTTGVRFRYKSQFLEDVYSFNDFIHDGHLFEMSKPEDIYDYVHQKPLLITEFCGHMFPTRKTDNELRIVQHALNHAYIHSYVRGQKDIHGALGWCAFDYNTHKEFGSGNSLDYHGVFDIFRNPKFAAYVYKSQKNIEDEAVLFPLTLWGFGERNIGGVTPLYVFHNGDKVYYQLDGGERIEIKDRDEHLNNLINPPVVLQHLNGIWGDKWRDVTFFLEYQGKIVKSKRLLCRGTISKLKVELSQEEIELNDAARVYVGVVDECETVLRHLNEPIIIECFKADLSCPKVVSLNGGEYAFYVRSISYENIIIRVKFDNFMVEKIVRIKS